MLVGGHLAGDVDVPLGRAEPGAVIEHEHVGGRLIKLDSRLHGWPQALPNEIHEASDGDDSDDD